jgi:hypothetical protein
MKKIIIALLALTSISAFADGICKTKILREGGDPSYGSTVKTVVQDVLRIKTLSDYGYTTEDKTLEDCLNRAQTILESTSDDINRRGRHEFPRIELRYSGDDADMKIVIKKKNNH